ncbi:MAG TPA: hypothetical protein PLN94_09250, partial [Thiolinea sp.]|nr:hypothetical protein [Thiolinea sp.]
MIARCFQRVNYPILPIISTHADDADEARIRFYHRNFRLFTPSDFDYSPYSEVIKYPAWNFSDQPVYRTLPWHFIDQADTTRLEKDKRFPDKNLIELNPTS